MKKTVWVFSLLVMLLSQVLSPFAYAVTGEETVIEEPVVEEVIEEPEVIEETKDSENPVEGSDIVVENKENTENAESNSWDNIELPEIESEVVSWDFESMSWDIDKLSWASKNLSWYSENLTWNQENLKEEIEILTWAEASSWFFEIIKEWVKNLLGIWNDENSGTNVEEFESKEIYWTWEYEWVEVEVYAATWLFVSWTILTIEPVIEEKLEQVKEVLISWDVQMIEEDEEQALVAFDITFRDPETQEELQPITWTVQVKFNYEENESLVQAEEKEDQEVKVYHLNDIDEEWNKIEELTWTTVEEVVVNEEESKDNEIVINTNGFSIYVINNISVKWAWDTITITYNANLWEFEGWDDTMEKVYSYSEPTWWTKYAHTYNINDAWDVNGIYWNYSSYKVITIPGAKKLHVSLKYSTENGCDYLYVFKGSFTQTPTRNMQAWQVYTFNWWNNKNTRSNTKDFYISWDTVTFSFYADSSVWYYWYYATIEGEWWYILKETDVKPSREWYWLLWWYETWSTELFDFEQDITENKTLYAKWVWNINVKYNANWWYFKTWDTITDEINVVYSNDVQLWYTPNINVQIPNRTAVEWENCSWWMFDWWYTTPQNQTTEWKWNVDNTTDDDLVLYAKWLPFNDKKITMNGITFTIMDRNLWATDFASWYSYGDMNLSKVWKYYQWWNNYWFENQSSTLSNLDSKWIDASSYLPWNYYYGQTFINGEKWDSSDNYNLWWWYSPYEPSQNKWDKFRQWPCPEWYHIPLRDEFKEVYELFKDWMDNTDEGKNYCNVSSINNNTQYCLSAKLWLPYAWYRSYSDSYKYSVWYSSRYWTSSFSEPNKAYYFALSSSTYTYFKWYWFPIRCFKDFKKKDIIYKTNWWTVDLTPNVTARWWHYTATKLPIPKKTDAIFLWWYKAEDFSWIPVETNGIWETDDENSVSLYAKWRDYNEDKTVIYDANWWYFSWWNLIKEMVYSEKYVSWNYIWNENFQFPIKDFQWVTWYMFDWWYIDAECVNEWTWVSVNSPITQTVYAKWLPFEDLTVTVWWSTFTIMDRNMWAEATAQWIYSQSDQESNKKLGKYYQRWNNYWFKNDEYPINSWSELVINHEHDDNPWWPWNYYYSNKYIKTSRRWDSNNNLNLWWWDSQANSDSDKQWPCPDWYHVPDIAEWNLVKSLFEKEKSKENGYCSWDLSEIWKCFAAKLELPFAGAMDSYNASAYGKWYRSYYRAANNCSYSSDESHYIYLYNTYISKDNMYYRANGYSLRCFKNTAYSITFKPNNWDDDFIRSNIRWFESISKPDDPVSESSWFIWWYDWDSLFDFSSHLNRSVVLEAKWEDDMVYELDANWWEFEDWETIKNVNITKSNWIYSMKDIVQIPNKERTSYIWTDWNTYYTWWMFAWRYTTSWDWNRKNQTEEWNWQSIFNQKLYARYLPFEDLTITIWWQTITMMDRNLWAEGVASGLYYWDWNHEDNKVLWRYYQWWNNYWFRNNGSPSNSWYDMVKNNNHDNNPWWPWNYYYSNKFLIRYSGIYRRDIDNNLNLWWWANQKNSDSDRKWPCPIWYHIPDLYEWYSVYVMLDKERKANPNYCLWELDNLAKCFSNKFNLPFVWSLQYWNASIYNQWKSSYYRSSTPYNNSSYSYDAYAFYLDNNYAYQSNSYRSYWFPVRCFKNTDPVNTLTIIKDNWEDDVVYPLRWWEGIVDDYNQEDPINKWYRFLWWYSWDNKFYFNWFRYYDSVTIKAKREKNPWYTYNAQWWSFMSWNENIWNKYIIKYSNINEQYETNEKIINPTRVWYKFLWWYEWTTWENNELIISNIPFDFTWTEVTKDRTFYAKWEPHHYTIKFDINWWTWNIKDINAIYWEKTILPKVTKKWYYLSWWKSEDWVLYKNYIPEWIWLTTEDWWVVILTAQRQVNPPSAWWWKTITPASKEQEHNAAEEQKQEEKKIIDQTEKEIEVEQVPSTTNNSSTQSTTRTTTNTSVDPLILSAYEWAYEHNITTISSLDEANPDWTVTRGHLAKMVVNYATNILWREIPEKIPSYCRWNDRKTDRESEEIKDYAVKSCALWLMWLDMEKFLPNMEVTRAQFGTIMSRLLWWKKYAWWTPYYRKHLNALKENNIMTQIENPEKRVELRQWVWLMLMRSAENK